MEKGKGPKAALLLGFGIFAVFSGIAAPGDAGQRVFLTVVGIGCVLIAGQMLWKK